MYYTYVLQSHKDNKLYVGYAQDLKLRSSQHNQGEVEATRNRRPFIMIYYEACLNQQDAIKREKYFKTGYGRRFLDNRMEGYNKDQARDGGQGKEKQKVTVKRVKGGLLIRDFRNK